MPKVTHGLSRKYRTEQRVWINMRQRCNNPNERWYHRYGGRDIRVCTRWDDFAAFMADMGPRPSSKHSIDRIDNNGDYTPENCRWATWSEQKLNSTSGPARMVLIGQRFGRLVAQYPKPKQPKRVTRWLCLCDCGNVTTVGIGHLRNGHTQSCGCLQRERTSAANRRRHS